VIGGSGSCNYGDHRVDFQQCGTLDGAKKYVQEAKKENYDYDWHILKGEILAEGDERGVTVHDPKFGVGL
jgi:hypothetical protein